MRDTILRKGAVRLLFISVPFALFLPNLTAEIFADGTDILQRGQQHRFVHRQCSAGLGKGTAYKVL